MRRKDRAVTDTEQIRSILDNIKTCRLAMVDDGRPYVIPLSYGYTLSEKALTVYFHSAKSGRKIDVLKKSPSVCMEISTEGEPNFSGGNACEYGLYYSGIIAFGNAEFVYDYEEKNVALKLITKHQSGVETSFTEAQTETVAVLKVQTTDFTAKAKSG